MKNHIRFHKVFPYFGKGKQRPIREDRYWNPGKSFDTADHGPQGRIERRFSRPRKRDHVDAIGARQCSADLPDNVGGRHVFHAPQRALVCQPQLAIDTIKSAGFSGYDVDAEGSAEATGEDGTKNVAKRPHTSLVTSKSHIGHMTLQPHIRFLDNRLLLCLTLTTENKFVNSIEPGVHFAELFLQHQY